MELVDARDVCDPNAVVIRDFEGRIRGHFERTGPNRWDDYRYLSRDGGIIRVRTGLRVQLESRGTVIRMRRRGRVIRVEWDGDAPDAGKPGRRIFAARHLRRIDGSPVLGAAAVIARKLKR